MDGRRENQLPPLNALRALDALARRGSLRAAADELGVVPGAVRQQLAALESYFGTPLLTRTGGRVTPNAAGRRLADAVGVALTIVSRAADEISAQNQRVRLRLGVPLPMAIAWLMPRLPRLLAETRNLDIDIVPIQVTLSLSEAPGLDAMIVGGEYRPLPDITATRFMDDAFGPVMAGETNGPPDLDQGAALVARNVAYLWDDWFRESGTPPVRFQKRIELEDLSLALGAAKAGLGVTIAPRASIEAELAAGALRAPFGFVSRPAGYRLCCRIADRDSKPVAALRNWLVEEGSRPQAAGNLPG
jgi:DNA-binding transcriptional LysR family regulator